MYTERFQLERTLNIIDAENENLTGAIESNEAIPVEGRDDLEMKQNNNTLRTTFIW